MLSIQITFRGIASSPALETHIRQRIEKLAQYYDRIMCCHVVVEMSQKHKKQGKIFNVRVDLKIPRKELAVTRKQDQDIYVALRDAFDTVERRLEEQAHKRHGRVKTHLAFAA